MDAWQINVLIVLAVGVLFTLVQIQRAAERIHKLLKELHESVQWGLGKEISQRQKDYFADQQNAILTEHKLKEARKKAGKPEPEEA